MKRRACLLVVTIVLTTAPFMCRPSTVLARSKTANVLIVGDSVSAVLRWAPESMKPLWESTYNVTLETWGCQSLLGPGCHPVAQLSALEQIQRHRKDRIKVVVVLGGYNDTGDANLATAMNLISQEVHSQHAALIWSTYREAGKSPIKNGAFNIVVRARTNTSRGIELLDWNEISRKNKHWFSGEGVHLNRFGGLQLARHIKKALDLHFSSNGTTTTTTTTSTTVASVGT